MNQVFAELLEALTDARTSLLSSVTGRAQEELDRRPSDGRWSAGEILHHLAKSEQGIAIMLTRGVMRVRAAGAVAIDGSHERPTRLAAIGIENGAGRSTAPTTLEPTQGLSLEDLHAALDRSRSTLVAAVESASDIDPRALRFPHPVLGELDMYEWLDFVARHEQRHRRQIERALENAPVTDDGAER